MNDPQRQFQKFVPYLSCRYPILLHAILALSACHLNRRDGTCNAIYAVHYNNLCVQGLITALEQHSTTLNNMLPIATVILRMYEMMNHETDTQQHLRGCSLLFTHNRRTAGYANLKQSAFWMYIREEIMASLATRRPTTIRPSCWKADNIWSEDIDCAKMEEITMLTAEVIDHCFGKDLDTKRWDELEKEATKWQESLPDTFQPLYSFSKRKPFPEVMYASSWHGMSPYFLLHYQDNTRY